ncbi:MAG TPA: sensor histidine kinase, partial [Rectinemataceae bacterium]|nr:sensor histidine kinase [Rectinemataceae bacterium]
MPELFELTSRLRDLETALPQAIGRERFEALLDLSWYLRQSDSRRALELAAEAERLLEAPDRDDESAARGRARLGLLRAEKLWLEGQLAEAEALLQPAKETFSAERDLVGQGDVEWLRVYIQFDRADREGGEAAMHEALACYERAEDERRTNLARARLAFLVSFRSAEECGALLARHFPADAAPHPVVMPWLLSARGNVFGLTGDQHRATACYTEAYHAAIDSGQTRTAIIAANNAADDFRKIGDFLSSLEWNELATTLARNAGWPVLIGLSLNQNAILQRYLGRKEAAVAALREALRIMRGVAGSRNYSLSLLYLADIAMINGDHADALAWYRRLESDARALGEPDLLMAALRGTADSLCRLGEPREALPLAREALALAALHGKRDEEFLILRVLAGLYGRHSLPAPEAGAESASELHYLERAMAVAQTMRGYALPAEFLDELAAARASAGDYRRAYETALDAARERAKERTVEARNRLISLEIEHETETVRASVEVQRQLALIESRRALALEQANERIQELLAEKELILREVHHRIKNNMYFISSIFRLQSLHHDDPQVTGSLNEAMSRVNSMMILYDKLYQSSANTSMSVRDYIPSLLDEITAIFPGGPAIDLDLELEDIVVGVKQLMHIGIIINEFVTNAMKYAFRGRERGRIALALRLERGA